MSAKLAEAMALTSESELRSKLARNTARDSLGQFGMTDPQWLAYATEYFWDESQAETRFADLRAHGFLPGSSKVLDCAAGCGQFVFRALEHGYDCHGVEPEPWKLEFLREKLHVTGRPPEWAERIREGVGERLPYEDNSFDLVTSYQTLEHVQDPAAVISEMVRVTRPGGGVQIRCPDYLSTFEAHYQLPWIPLFPRPLARLYLRALRRPTVGLDTLQYPTSRRVAEWFHRVERETNCLLKLEDDERAGFAAALRRRRLPNLPGAYSAHRFVRSARNLFRAELSLSIFVRVLSK